MTDELKDIRNRLERYNRSRQLTIDQYDDMMEKDGAASNLYVHAPADITLLLKVVDTQAVQLEQITTLKPVFNRYKEHAQNVIKDVGIFEQTYWRGKLDQLHELEQQLSILLED